MTRRFIQVLLAVVIMILSAGFGAVHAREEAAPVVDAAGGEAAPPICLPVPATSPLATASPVPATSRVPATNVPAASPLPAASPAPSPAQVDRDRLTGDWGGTRPWLREHGLTILPRITLFYQGLSSGEGPHSFEASGKADVQILADLGKMGLHKGFGLTVHAEQNFGNNVNGRGGGLVMVNTGMGFPADQGNDTFDLSSFYFSQSLGKGTTLLVGKVNAIDLASTKPFMGGAGIDGFWNCTFAAPPSGTVPPYLFGALLSMRTKNATYGFWVYDPTSVVNKSCFDKPFSAGITFRGSVEFPVKIGDLEGHQGLTALYSTERGRDMATVGDLLLPGPRGPIGVKNSRYYFAYSFDQYLYQSKENPKEGVGIFGQFGISDGNPNRLYYSALVGVGGTGLVPGRSRDNWGVGYYYDAPSTVLKNSLAPFTILRNEQGWEAFYNFEVTPGFTVGADVQIIRPATSNVTALFPGLRTVLKF